VANVSAQLSSLFRGTLRHFSGRQLTRRIGPARTPFSMARITGNRSDDTRSDAIVHPHKAGQFGSEESRQRRWHMVVKFI